MASNGHDSDETDAPREEDGLRVVPEGYDPQQVHELLAGYKAQMDRLEQVLGSVQAALGASQERLPGRGRARRRTPRRSSSPRTTGPRPCASTRRRSRCASRPRAAAQAMRPRPKHSAPLAAVRPGGGVPRPRRALALACCRSRSRHPRRRGRRLARRDLRRGAARAPADARRAAAAPSDAARRGPVARAARRASRGRGAAPSRTRRPAAVREPPLPQRRRSTRSPAPTTSGSSRRRC